MKKTNKKGFTLVELVIVIAVIAILAAVLIPTFSGIIGKAKQNAAMQEAKNVYTMYTVDNAESGDFASEAYVKTSKGYYVHILKNAVVNEAYSTTQPSGVIFWESEPEVDETNGTETPGFLKSASTEYTIYLPATFKLKTQE